MLVKNFTNRLRQNLSSVKFFIYFGKIIVIMKKVFLSLAVGILSAHLFAADITGTITLKGTPPPEVEIAPIMDDSTCGQMYDKVPTTHFYVVGKNGEFGDVLV